MAIDAKASFMMQTEKRMAEEMTGAAAARALSIIADVMEGFDIREIRIGEEQDDLLACYADALKVQGRSAKTVERYVYLIGRMLQEVKVPVRRVTVYHLRSYLAMLQEHGLADTSVEGIRQVFHAFFGWLQRESLIEKNPAANLGAVKCAKKKKQTISDVEMYSLRMNCQSARDRAIVMFLASTGCRVSEMTELNRDAVDLYGMQCVVHGKGNKERTVFLDSVTASELRKYLSQRTDRNPALFVNRFGNRIRPDGVRYMLRDLAKKAEVQ